MLVLLRTNMANGYFHSNKKVKVQKNEILYEWRMTFVLLSTRRKARGLMALYVRTCWFPCKFKYTKFACLNMSWILLQILFIENIFYRQSVTSDASSVFLSLFCINVDRAGVPLFSMQKKTRIRWIVLLGSNKNNSKHYCYCIILWACL